MRTWREGALLAVVVALAAAGCDLSGPWDAEGCIPTRLVVKPTEARTQRELVLTAVLQTRHHEPVVGERVQLVVTDDLDKGGQPVAGISDAEGMVQVDLAASYGTDPFLTSAINTGRLVSGRYQSDVFAPRGTKTYCSAEAHTRFAYSGPRLTWPPPLRTRP